MLPSILNWSFKKTSEVRGVSYFNIITFFMTLVPLRTSFQKLHFKRSMLRHYTYEMPPTYYFLTVWQVKPAEKVTFSWRQSAGKKITYQYHVCNDTIHTISQLSLSRERKVVEAKSEDRQWKMKNEVKSDMFSIPGFRSRQD